MLRASVARARSAAATQRAQEQGRVQAEVLARNPQVLVDLNECARGISLVFVRLTVAQG